MGGLPSINKVKIFALVFAYGCNGRLNSQAAPSQTQNALDTELKHNTDSTVLIQQMFCSLVAITLRPWGQDHSVCLCWVQSFYCCRASGCFQSSGFPRASVLLSITSRQHLPSSGGGACTWAEGRSVFGCRAVTTVGVSLFITYISWVILSRIPC